MDVTQKGLLTLVKSALDGKGYDLPAGFSLEAEDTIALMKKHHLMALIYPGAVNCKIPSDNPIMKQLFAFYCKHMVFSEKQMMALGRVFQAFEEHGIDYLPTKGCNLKALYPKPEMRSMGDADITIRREQLESIDELMPRLGFTPAERGTGTVVWDSPALHLELHMHMNSFYNQKYYDDVWERVKVIEGHRCGFNTEDTFIHVFNHFARHYRCGGIGCRHLIDIYVLRRAYPKMDEAYILEEMKKIHLQKFYKNACDLLEVWFGDAAFNESTLAIHEYIFNSGSWGSVASHATAKQVEIANESGEVSNFRSKAILKTVLPDFESMKGRYPILEKAPFLLPVTWLLRWGKAIRIGKDHVPGLVKEWKAIEDEKVLSYQEQFRLAGLDIENEK